MNILEKIDMLRVEKGWTVYQLAEESGVSQSTLSNMFIRKTLPSITTLEALCKGFGISLADFFADTLEDKKSIDENSLIKEYRKLSNKNKEIIKKLICDLQ